MTRAALFFATEAYSTGGPRLMGRHAAGEGFLRAYARHATAEALECYAATRREGEAFAAMCQASGSGTKPVRWIPFGQLNALREAGTLFYPGPELAENAWARRRIGGPAYSIVGITHTIASHTVMDAICNTLAAPVEPWDALVCTSRAVVDSVQRLLGAQGEFLKSRFGVRQMPRVTLALIPLGADCERLAPDAALRQAWRAKLGIAGDDVAFLFLGRLSYHAKANPFPMYVALEEAARRSGKRIHLIQAGWFANAAIEAQFRDGAKQFCPGVNAIFLDGRELPVRHEIWHAADAFTSLSDNVQETFGLTPVEAMAAGLPGVISDWNGYKDTVRDGVDGFRIPTLAPPPGAGADLAARHEHAVDNYDHYIGNASQFVSVDARACAEACTRLAQDAELRRTMGAAASARARAEFDWPVIVRKYEELWAGLAKIRARAQPAKPAPIANPRRADPFWMFAGYPTHTLTPASTLALAPGATAERLQSLRGIQMLGFGGATLPDQASCAEFMKAVAASPGITVAAALAGFEPAQRALLGRGIVWLSKLGLIHVTPVAVKTPVPAATAKPKPEAKKPKKGKRRR